MRLLGPIQSSYCARDWGVVGALHNWCLSAARGKQSRSKHAQVVCLFVLTGTRCARGGDGRAACEQANQGKARRRVSRRSSEMDGQARLPLDTTLT